MTPHPRKRRFKRHKTIRSFPNLAAFLKRCRVAVARDGRGATVTLHYHGQVAPGTRLPLVMRPYRIDVVACHWSPDTRTTVCTVSADAVLSAHRQGLIVNTDAAPQVSRRHPVTPETLKHPE